MTHILAEVKRRSEERKGNIDDREFLEIYNSITRP